jgi:hypothetical protein
MAVAKVRIRRVINNGIANQDNGQGNRQVWAILDRPGKPGKSQE